MSDSIDKRSPCAETVALESADDVSEARHFHVFVWHRHDGWHEPRGRATFGWHGHVLFHHEHGSDGAKERRR